MNKELFKCVENNKVIFDTYRALKNEWSLDDDILLSAAYSMANFEDALEFIEYYVGGEYETLEEALGHYAQGCYCEVDDFRHDFLNWELVEQAYEEKKN